MSLLYFPSPLTAERGRQHSRVLLGREGWGRGGRQQAAGRSCQFNSIQFNSLFHFTQSNTTCTVFSNCLCRHSPTVQLGTCGYLKLAAIDNFYMTENVTFCISYPFLPDCKTTFSRIFFIFLCYF